MPQDRVSKTSAPTVTSLTRKSEVVMTRRTVTAIPRPRTRPQTRRAYRHSGLHAQLPREEAPAPPVAVADATVEVPAIANPPAAVLVVDDEPVNRVLLARVLSKAGHQIHTAANGEQALQFLAEEPDIELVLLDYYMPGLNGLDVLRRVRADDALRHLAVLLVTSSEATDDIVAGLDAGADDYLTKPVNPRVLLARIRNALRLRRMERELDARYTELRTELTAAQELQLDLIPNSPYERAGVRAAWRYLPSLYVGGDILGIARRSADETRFYLADVSGHGVAAALLAFWIHDTLEADTHRPVTGGAAPALDPAAILGRLDDKIAAAPVDRYCTAVHGVVNGATGRLTYCVGGHPRPILLRRSGDVALLEEAGTPVGMGLGLPYPTGEIQLAPGDRLFLYTDGISESTALRGAHAGEMAGQERLLEWVRSTRALALEPQLDAIVGQLIRWRGEAAFEDDVTLMAIERPLAAPQ